jgi:hypothetical protein
LVLLLDIILRTALLRLPNIMLLLGIDLRLAIAGDASDSSRHSPTDAVRDAGAKIAELALGFLSFAARVLFPALLFKTLI